MNFPENFAWGAASAAYQIEGAAFEDGKGASIWDVYSNDTRPDPRTGRTNIRNLDTANVACDHYHRYKEDVALMKAMGLNAYRFSVSWSRVLPDGRGKVNQKGLRFYSDLVDELLNAGIEPYVTLFHWDLPQALQDIGGWANPEMPSIFADYVKVVVEALSDRVTHWMTLNEAQCHIIIGHIDGNCAPKLHVTQREGFYLINSILKAHSLAVGTIRAYAVKIPLVGIATNPSAFYPASDSKADVDAARTQAFSAAEKNLWATTWWLDPIILGKYPEDGIDAFKADFPEDLLREDNMTALRSQLDFLGCNLYQGTAVQAGAAGKSVCLPRKPGFNQTAFKWEVTPEILRYMPDFLYGRYGLPVIITENGLSMADWIALDGKVHDPQRIDFMHRYLLELRKAISDGTPVAGYFAWSVMDNYEWSEGFGERFGLIHVDYSTQQRTIKDSGLWYRGVIASNGGSL